MERAENSRRTRTENTPSALGNLIVSLRPYVEKMTRLFYFIAEKINEHADTITGGILGAMLLGAGGYFLAEHIFPILPSHLVTVSLSLVGFVGGKVIGRGGLTSRSIYWD